MKNLTQTVLFLLIFSQTLFFSGCITEDKLVTEIRPQFDETECADLSTSDLDLSPGFKGTYSKNTDPDLADFSILSHNNMYEFASSVDAGDCDGVCAFRVVFEPSVETMSWPTENIEISNVNVSYMDASLTVNQPVISWSWSYPNLDIEVVYVNVITDYAVDFADNYASELNIADVEILGGLCVIENVDAIDPIYMIRIPDKRISN